MHEFMASHLAATVPVPTLRLMHLRVAEAAESMHWPASAHHYIEAGEGEQAMRVISDATIARPRHRRLGQRHQAAGADS